MCIWQTGPWSAHARWPINSAIACIRFPWEAIGDLLPRVGLLVNTTSLGMDGQPALELDTTLLPPQAVVADLVYAPLETPLLAAAQRRSLKRRMALGMLLHQAVGGFERWFGRRPRSRRNCARWSRPISQGYEGESLPRSGPTC